MKKIKYDFVVIFYDDENVEQMKELVVQKIKKFGYEIKEIENWGSKLLAYPIKKENKGYYVLYNLAYESKEEIISEEIKEKERKFTNEIDKLQYEEDKILKFIMVRL